MDELADCSMVVVLITMVSTVQIETYIMLCAAKFTQHVIGARRPATFSFSSVNLRLLALVLRQ